MPQTLKQQIFAQGQRIITEGERATAAYQIESGAAHVFMNKNGKIVTLAILEKGAIFGEMALYSESEYSANIEAHTDNTIVSIITPDVLQEKLKNTDPLVTHILDTLMKRLQSTNSALLESETRTYIEIDLV